MPALLTSTSTPPNRSTAVATHSPAPAAVGEFWQSRSLDELARLQGVGYPNGDEEFLGGWPEEELDDGFEDAVAIVRKWVVVGPNGADDVHPRILAVRMYGDQPAARTERLGEGRDHAFGFELDRRPRPIGLRGDDEVEIGFGPPGPRNDLVEQKAVVLPIEHQRHRSLVERHAGARADAGAPVLLQEGPQIRDLSLEIA